MFYNSEFQVLLVIFGLSLLGWTIIEAKDAKKWLRLGTGMASVCLLIVYYERALLGQGLDFGMEIIAHTDNVDSLVLLLEEESPPEVFPALKQYQLDLHGDLFQSANIRLAEDLHRLTEEYSNANPDAFLRD